MAFIVQCVASGRRAVMGGERKRKAQRVFNDRLVLFGGTV